MAERYSKTFSLVSNLYTAGSPLIIAAGALLKDNTDGRIIAQLKFKNIQAKAVKLVKVAISSLDALGRPLGEETEYQYLDLNESRDKEFGSKNAILLTDSSARSFSARIMEVGFEDNSVWSAKENAVWSTLPAMEEIRSKYNGEVLTQVQLTYGKACKYIPAKEGDLWICSCGAVNSNSEQNCHSCNCSKTDILYIDYAEMEIAAQKRVTAAKNDAIYASAIKTASLKEFDKPFSTVNLEKAIVELEKIPDWKYSKAKIAEFKTKIQELKDKEKAEKEAAVKKAKKNKIIAAITIPLVVAAIAFVIVLFKVIIPNSNYNNAMALLDAGKYEEAISAFEALDGYKDSADMVLESQYQYATALMEDEEYYQANEIFVQLAEQRYKDSVKMKKYSKALGRMKEGLYSDAITYFKAIGDFKDSTAKIEECNTAISQKRYNEALELMNQGKYTEALPAFEKLGNFSDSKAKIEECQNAISQKNYDEALELMNQGKYVEALTAFEKLGDFSYSKAKLEECQERLYTSATTLMNQYKYNEAISIFNSIISYKDSSKKITECNNAMNDDTYIVDMAYALEKGGQLDGTYTLTGKITSIDTAYSIAYRNISFTIVVKGRENKPIVCFRIKGDGIQNLAVGDTVTVTGKIINYADATVKGKVEINAGGQVTKIVKG